MLAEIGWEAIVITLSTLIASNIYFISTEPVAIELLFFLNNNKKQVFVCLFVVVTFLFSCDDISPACFFQNRDSAVLIEFLAKLERDVRIVLIPCFMRDRGGVETCFHPSF